MAEIRYLWCRTPPPTLPPTPFFLTNEGGRIFCFLVYILFHPLVMMNAVYALVLKKKKCVFGGGGGGGGVYAGSGFCFEIWCHLISLTLLELPCVDFNPRSRCTLIFASFRYVASAEIDWGWWWTQASGWQSHHIYDWFRNQMTKHMISVGLFLMFILLQYFKLNTEYK